jgi:Zn-dependent protease
VDTEERAPNSRQLPARVLSYSDTWASYTKERMFDLSTVIIGILVFTVALTFHEFCHAATAYLLGDMTAQRLGRLTLNPLAHIDPLGFILLILIRFGWAKPVPFNPHNFTYPRFYSILVAIAGPLSNILLACISLIALHHTPTAFSTALATLWQQFFELSVWINVMLGVFNLLPIPPLDGSHFLRICIPEKYMSYYYGFSRISFIVLIVVISLYPVRMALIHTIAQVIQFLEYIL